MRDFETNSQRNGYLLNRMLFKYEYGEDVSDVFNMRRFYDRLTAADASRRGANVPEPEPLRRSHAAAGR